MTSVAKIKGTSVSSFTIGLKGATLYQGASTDGIANPQVGDLFIKTGATPKVLQYSGSVWTALSPLPEWDVVLTNQTIAINTNYMVDTTSGAITVTLPASPNLGDRITIVDGTGYFSTNNLTITPTGTTIMGQTGKSLLVSTANATIDLVFFNSANGWRVLDSSSFGLQYV
jgi:hypothetical protein